MVFLAVMILNPVGLTGAIMSWCDMDAPSRCCCEPDSADQACPMPESGEPVNTCFEEMDPGLDAVAVVPVEPDTLDQTTSAVSTRLDTLSPASYDSSKPQLLAKGLPKTLLYSVFLV